MFGEGKESLKNKIFYVVIFYKVKFIEINIY